MQLLFHLSGRCSSRSRRRSSRRHRSSSRPPKPSTGSTAPYRTARRSRSCRLARKLEPHLQIVLLHVELGDLVRLQKLDQLANSFNLFPSIMSLPVPLAAPSRFLQLDPGLRTRRQHLSARRRHQHHIFDAHAKLARHINTRFDRNHHSRL